MAKGKDAFSHALMKLNFYSIKFENNIVKNYWCDLIPNLSIKENEKYIENPAQRVVLEISSSFESKNLGRPLIFLCQDSKNLNPDIKIIFEASSGEDCARLLFISHIVTQRFATPVCLVISNECLEEKLKFKPEHIPFPPKYVIREKTWEPDKVKSDHPALTFKRVYYGYGRGPRDRANLLIISHGKDSLKIKKLIKDRNPSNIRHLELQTLKPISREIIRNSMKSVKQTITTLDTSIWIDELEKIKKLDFDDISKLL